MAKLKSSKTKLKTIERFNLTDDEWSLLCKYRRFDNEQLESGVARMRINKACVSYCLAFEAGLQKLMAKDINAVIKKVSKKLDGLKPLAAKLQKFNEQKQYIDQFTRVYWAKGTTFVYGFNQQHLDSLDALTKLFQTMTEELPSVKKGSKKHLLVEQLVFEVQIQLFLSAESKNKISRSLQGYSVEGLKNTKQTSMNFFVKLFEILETKVGSKVTKGTIEGAIENVVKEFRSNPKRAKMMTELGLAKKDSPEAMNKFFSNYGDWPLDK